MYNRYIPQPDGSFCRKQIPEAPPPKPKPCSENPKPPEESPCPNPEPIKPAVPADRCKHCPNCRQRTPNTETSTPSGVTSLLSQFLPKDFDTGDLMVVLLLLLMAGDCPENQSNALLTLALYLFL